VLEGKTITHEKGRKYFGRYLLVDCTQDGDGTSQCPVYTEILQNISVEPSKLKLRF
jgi:hypothetical protein